MRSDHCYFRAACHFMDASSRVGRAFVGEIPVATWRGALGLARGSRIWFSLRPPAIHAAREIR